MFGQGKIGLAQIALDDFVTLQLELANLRPNAKRVFAANKISPIGEESVWQFRLFGVSDWRSSVRRGRWFRENVGRNQGSVHIVVLARLVTDNCETDAALPAASSSERLRVSGISYSFAT
jgi:hypothetical protein